jgi:predicted HTH transcriptional regulator
MAFLTTERLLEDAKNGTKLGIEDRRRVILFLTSTQPELSNRDLAEIFQTSEASIRRDKQALPRGDGL